MRYICLICPNSSLLVCVCVWCLSVVWGGFQTKQPAPVTAPGHSEECHSDQVGSGKGHAGDNKYAQKVKQKLFLSSFTTKSQSKKLIVVELVGQVLCYCLWFFFNLISNTIAKYRNPYNVPFVLSIRLHLNPGFIPSAFFFIIFLYSPMGVYCTVSDP